MKFRDYLNKNFIGFVQYARPVEALRLPENLMLTCRYMMDQSRSWAESGITMENCRPRIQ